MVGDPYNFEHLCAFWHKDLWFVVAEGGNEEDGETLCSIDARILWLNGAYLAPRFVGSTILR